MEDDGEKLRTEDERQERTTTEDDGEDGGGRKEESGTVLGFWRGKRREKLMREKKLKKMRN